MPAQPNLIVVIYPQLTAATIGDYPDPLPELSKLSPQVCRVFIEPVRPATSGAQEATYLSGLLPETHGQIKSRGKAIAMPPEPMAFWTRAAQRRPALQFNAMKMEDAFRGLGSNSGLLLCKFPWPGARSRHRLPDADGAILRSAKWALREKWVLCMLGVSGRDNDLGRNLMIGVGFGHNKTLIGACEVAGILDRVLTGVELGDKV